MRGLRNVTAVAIAFAITLTETGAQSQALGTAFDTAAATSALFRAIRSSDVRASAAR